jgi:hypothetical protein
MKAHHPGIAVSMVIPGIPQAFIGELVGRLATICA